MMKVLFPFIMFMCCLPGMAQEDVVVKVTQQLERQRQTHPMMRPLIFFNQDTYAPGDTAFFRVFILTEDEKILKDRILLNFELIDARGTVILRQYIPCEKPGAANQLILPGKAQAGVYKLLVFSERMTKNFGLALDFIIAGENRLEVVKPKELKIEFFPEGGNFVAGTVNRLVIHSNIEILTEAGLYSKEGKVTSFTFSGNGYGAVVFTPQPGQEYWIEVTTGDGKNSIPLPKGSDAGLTLSVYSGPRKISIIDMVGSSSYRGKKIFLILKAQRQIVYGSEVRLNAEGKMLIFAAPDFFPEGYSHLFVIDSNQTVLAHRPLYRKPTPSLRLNISDIPAVVKQRQTVTAGLKLTDEKGDAMTGAFAITVFGRKAQMKKAETPDASLILNPDQIDVDLSNPEELVNQELISMLSNRPQRIHPEYDLLRYRSNLTLTGRANFRDHTPLPDSSRILIYLHKDLIQYEAHIDNEGHFQFPKIYDFFGRDLAFFKVQHKKKDLSRVQVTWLTDSSKRVPPSFSKTFAGGEKPDEYGILRMQKKEIDESYSFFTVPAPAPEVDKNPNEAFEDEFQRADIVVNPRDYVPFNSMEELALEVIPSLEFRKRQSDSIIRVMLTTRSPYDAQRYADGNPLYIIDGWMTTNTAYLMNLKPGEIAFVKIINGIGKIDRLGNLARNGILFVQSKSPEKTKAALAGELLPLNGLSPMLQFSNHFPLDKRVPDLRTALFWTPFLRTDATGSGSFQFRTSDDIGEYTVRVMGTSDDGRLVTAEFPFSIAFGK